MNTYSVAESMFSGEAAELPRLVYRPLGEADIEPFLRAEYYSTNLFKG